MRRSVTVNYCDDIREEVGNKLSLIGLYSSDLVVSEVPTVLPKLCIFVQIFNNSGETYADEIAVRVMIDDQVISEQKFPPVTGAPPLHPDAFQTSRCQVILSPFVITKPCRLRARAYFGEEELKGAALRIQVASETRPSADETGN